MKKDCLIALAILAYCAFNAFDLIITWRTILMEKYSWVVFLIWCSPVVAYWLTPKLQSPNDKLYSPYLLWPALILSFLGQIGSLNVIQHIGLALAIASFFPFSSAILLWLPSSVTWMTLWSWFVKYYAPNFITPGRFIIVILSIIALFITQLFMKKLDLDKIRLKGALDE